ncbi:MAG: DUF3025 domain-containing protein [Gammaproteobacteria bacterium]
MKKVDQWIPEYWNTSPMFSDHRRFIGQAIDQNSEMKHWEYWPDCNELNQLWPHKNKTLSGYDIKFIPQDSLNEGAVYYEEHIFSSGKIPTRDKNWHDFFNAQVWLQFPETKAVLNAQHVEEIKKHERNINKKNRTGKRDALTLFDESGVIFVTDKVQVIEDLRSHQWKELFIQKRQQWWESISVYIFGHGLYEKAFSPYVGMTGNAMPIIVEESFFDQERSKQIKVLDQKISQGIQSQKILETSSNLNPLPLLGIPGWWKENENESFYDNKNYFRPKRK